MILCKKKYFFLVGMVGGVFFILDLWVNGKEIGYKEFFCYKVVKYFKVLLFVIF